VLEPACKDAIARQVRIPQIIVGALAAGPVFFLVIVIVLVQQGFSGTTDIGPILTYLAVAFAVLAVSARLIVPNLIVARARRGILSGTWHSPQSVYSQSQHPQPAQEDLARFFEQTGDAGKLFYVFHTRTIVAAAILEGTAFFGLIAYLSEGSLVALVLAVAMIIAVAAHFPTRSGVLEWIEGQLRLLERERQFGR